MGLGEGLLIIQVALLLLVGRGLGELMQRIGQPAVIGQLLAGLILGPSLFGWAWPSAHNLLFPKDLASLKGLGDVGVLMLLLLTGMEIDVKLARRVGRPALAIVASGILVPFVSGFALGELLPSSLLSNPGHRLTASLFLGTALSISSIKIVAMVVREMRFMRRDLGQIIVASAIMEDTVGWIIIALTLGVAGAAGAGWDRLATAITGTAMFLLLAFTIGRRLVFRLIRTVNDHFVSEYAVVTAILLVMLVLALATQLIGINTVLGAFVAGVLIGQSPILTGQIQDQLRGFITAFLMPIFFGMSGLSADLTVLRDPTLALLTLGLIAVASIGKFSGAFLGSRISGLTGAQALAVGCGMNARGSTEVIVASIGLGVGALTHELYTMIVVMAVVTTTAMPPMLRWALRRLPMAQQEAERLEKEEVDALGFLAAVERVLVVADESANGRFAARLAGAIAGQNGLLLTVLEAPGAGKPRRNVEPERIAAAASRVGERHSRREAAGAADILTIEPRAGLVETVAGEAEKGFDLVFVGLDRATAADGRFSEDVNGIAGRFKCPIALTIAGQGGGDGWPTPLRMLLAVNGTQAARKGAELAVTVAPTWRHTAVTAVQVAQRRDGPGESGAAGPRRGRTEKAVIADLRALGERHEIEIASAVHLGRPPEDAILAEARLTQSNLIVIGANRRVGDELDLGRTVAAVLQQWGGALLLLAV